MTPSTHEHQWAYIGDVALIIRKGDTNAKLRRCEYCVGCSTLRVEFPSGWYVMQGNATKEFMSHFEEEKTGKVFRLPPKGFRPTAAKTENRLGRGLTELMAHALPPTFIK